MKIAFIYDLPEEHLPFWNDGLKAALDVLQNKYGWEIIFWNISELPQDDSFLGIDIGLFWGGLTNPMCKYRVFKKQALCFGGGPTYTPEIHNFDLIFAESKIDFLDFKRFGKETIQAFGTNTKLFRPMPEQPKIFEYVYPAAFAKWKHHEKFATFVADKERNRIIEDEMPGSLAFGYMQPGGWEKECYEICQQNGIAVLPQVTYSVMPYILNAAKNVYVGADINGGCQRTILEAKACNVNVVVDSDSPKLLELANLTHEQVTKDYSEEAYANKLKKGLEKLLNG